MFFLRSDISSHVMNADRPCGLVSRLTNSIGRDAAAAAGVGGDAVAAAAETSAGRQWRDRRAHLILRARARARSVGRSATSDDFANAEFAPCILTRSNPIPKATVNYIAMETASLFSESNLRPAYTRDAGRSSVVRVRRRIKKNLVFDL